MNLTIRNSRKRINRSIRITQLVPRSDLELTKGIAVDVVVNGMMVTGEDDTSAREIGRRCGACSVKRSLYTKQESATRMPDPQSLQVGDLVRFIGIPEEWSQSGYRIQRSSILFMKNLIRRTWPSRVSRIDDTGFPWIEARIRNRGRIEYHSWMITEPTGWETKSSMK